MQSNATTSQNGSHRRKPRKVWREADFVFEREGRKNWRDDVLNGLGDVEQAVRRHMARYPSKMCELEAFDNSTGREKTYKGYNLLGGRERQNLDDRAGVFGRFIVAVGFPFEVSIIYPDELGFELPNDPREVFDSAVIDTLQQAFEQVCDGPYVFKLERGEAFDQRLHIMAAHGLGACSVGWRRDKPNGPKDALPCAAYFSKKQRPTFENLMGYVLTFREYGSVGRRLRYGRLGRQPVRFADVQALLPHLDLLRPQRNPEIAVSVDETRHEKKTMAREVSSVGINEVDVVLPATSLPKIKASYSWSCADQAATVVYRYKYLRSSPIKLPKRPLSFEPEPKAY